MYEELLGKRMTPEAMQGLAATLRGDDARMMLAQLSGDAVLGPIGQQGMRRVDDRAAALRQSLLRREEQDRLAQQEQARAAERAAERAATEQYRTRQYGLQQARAKAEEEWRAMQEARWNADRAAKERIAMARAESSGKPRLRPAPPTLRRELRAVGETSQIMDQLTATLERGLEPGSTGIPFERTLRQAMVRIGLSLSEQDNQVQAFWNNFNRIWNLVKRQEKFGATLSPQEKKSWEEATVSKEMTSQQIGNLMRIMQKYEHWDKARQLKAALTSGFYSPNEILSLAGEDPVMAEYYSSIDLEAPDLWEGWDDTPSDGGTSEQETPNEDGSTTIERDGKKFKVSPRTNPTSTPNPVAPATPPVPTPTPAAPRGGLERARGRTGGAGPSGPPVLIRKDGIVQELTFGGL